MDDKLNNFEDNNKSVETNNTEERKQLNIEADNTNNNETIGNDEKKEFTNIFADILVITKKWFSKQPLSAFARRLDYKTSLTLFAGHLLISMLIFFLSFNSLVSLLDGLNFLNRSDLSLRMVLPIFSIHLIYYGLLTLTVMIIARLIKTPNNTYKDSLSLVSIALLPVTILALAGFVLGIIIPQLIPLFYIMQFFVYLISLYMGLVVHLGKSEKSPFWIYPVAMLIMFVLFMLILSSISRAIVTGQVNNFNNSIYNGF